MQRLGEMVGVGLLADASELARFREQCQSGVLKELWQRFTRTLPAEGATTSDLSAGSLAFAAYILKRSDLADLATKRALQIARSPWDHWIHPEAGCTALVGIDHAVEICLATDWLWPTLNRDQREALVGALVAKAVENHARSPEGFRTEDDQGMLLTLRRMDPADPHCMHKLSEQLNNWDSWFSSALLMAAALAERAFLCPLPDEPKLTWGRYYSTGYTLDSARVARWRAVALERIRGVIANQFGPDGDYGEGISYLSYGGNALLYALRAAPRTAGVDLLTDAMARLPHWARNQYLADPAFGVANFNDSQSFTKPPFAITAYLAARFRDSQTQGYLAEAVACNSDTPIPLDLLCVDPTLAAAPVTLADESCYRRTGQVVWRTAQTRDGTTFMLQCGAHGGAHQHQDRGNFFLAAYGERLLVDAGDNRYIKGPTPFVHGVTAAHNMILIDGRGQIGDNLSPCHGTISDYRADAQRATVLADATACYSGVTACRRRVVFIRPDLFVIADHVAGTCTRLDWPMQGYDADGMAAWSLDGASALLTRPQASLHLFFLEPVTSWKCLSTVMDGKPKQIKHVAARIAGAGATVVLTPLRPDEAPPQFTRDGDDGVSITFRGKTTHVRRESEMLIVDDERYSL